MLLTTKAKYAIAAMIDLGKMTIGNDAKISVYEIAEKQKISVPYLEQIFVKLRHAGIVYATKGPNGGYMFAKDIKDIKLSDIISAVNENIKMTNCDECRATDRLIGGKPECDTHYLWVALGQHIKDFFDKITVFDAIKDC